MANPNPNQSGGNLSRTTSLRTGMPWPGLVCRFFASCFLMGSGEYAWKPSIFRFGSMMYRRTSPDKSAVVDGLESDETAHCRSVECRARGMRMVSGLVVRLKIGWHDVAMR